MNESRYELNCLMTKSDAVRLISALADALIGTTYDECVKVRGWRSYPGSERLFIEIDEQPAGCIDELHEEEL
jgi:hypothetical protein